MAARQADTVAHDNSNGPQDNATSTSTADNQAPQNNNNSTAAAASASLGPMDEAKIAAENVKNLKRKVISIAKLTEIFNKKDAGMLTISI